MTPKTFGGRRPRPARRAAALIVVLASVASACGGGDDEAADSTVPETAPPTTEVEAVEPTETVATTVAPSTTLPPPPPTAAPVEADIPRLPLTGEPLDGQPPVNRPALAIKIDNANAARANHSGLNVADIVFEEIVEDENTRFAAVFHSEIADPVGPVRSGRTQDIDLLTSFNQPLFGWSGGNSGVTRLISESFLTSLSAQQVPNAYSRGAGRAPSNLYTSTEALWALTPELHPGAPQQQYLYLLPGEEFTGEPAATLDLEMRRRDVSWDWNPEAGAYERSMDGSPHVDQTYGQISFQNVIVMVTDYQPSSVDARSPEAQTVANGPVYVFSGGRVMTGRYLRDNNVSPLRFVDDAGQPIRLTPGKTWIHLAEAIPTDDAANPGVALSWG